MNDVSRLMDLDRANRRGKVFVCWCSGDSVDSAWAMSMMALLFTDRHNIVGYAGANSSPRIAPTRNQLVDKFLAHEAQPEWMLMVDTDMVFPDNIVERMLQHADPKDVPILGALCFGGGKGPKLTPTLYRLVSTDPFDIRPAADFPRDQMVRVNATGAAFFLCHRSVLERMRETFAPKTAYPYFEESQKDGAQLGEDITFFLRAGQLGFPVHVHTGIEVGHRKPMLLDLEQFEKYQKECAASSADEVSDNYLRRLHLNASRA